MKELTVMNMDWKKNNKEACNAFISSLYTTTSDEWSLYTKKRLSEVFAVALKDTKAYPLFLKKNHSTWLSGTKNKNLELVPSINKNNYLRAYPWKDLCKHNVLTKEPLVMTSTSGSTGEPFYFPRTQTIDMQSSLSHEMFLRHAQISKKESVLVIDCFGMGVWIGGLITYQAFKHSTERGRPITIITPGINKQEIFQAIKNLAPSFDTVILCGYPPFMKDLVDHAKDNGINWSKYSVKVIFAAESFSELFRDHIAKKIGIKNVYRDTVNIYGSADLGTMAQETPLSILLRRLALKHKELYVQLFKQSSRLPTFAQFIPQFVAFEAIDESVYCSGDNALPLFRYEIGDNGAVISYNEVKNICKKSGIDLKAEIRKAGIVDTVTELPFISIYERTDFSTKLYGAIIYPEFIKKGLQAKNVSQFVTGKFTMFTHHDENQDEYLEVNIELQPKVKVTSTLTKNVTVAITKSLIAESAEHKNNTTLIAEDKIAPRIIFWQYGDETHFKGAGKQKWVKK